MTAPRLYAVPAPAAADRAAEDAAWMAEFKAGDARAFERLYERHKRGVYNFCRRMLGGRGDAGEAMQEVFLRVIRASRDWSHEAKFTTWLYTIARNYCHDKLRRKDGAEIATDGAGVNLPFTVPSADPQLREILSRAIGGLPEEQREVFVMRAYLEMSFPEIAEVVAQPLNTTKSRMRLALERLKSELAGAGVVE
jgi:RNA polymerase sigma-70 factor (ECF subfamily)